MDTDSRAQGAKTVTAYYNDNNYFSVEWLRQLINHGYISNGIVDERNIQNLIPGEGRKPGLRLRNYKRVHLFAGIGGWDLALHLADWPEDRTVWTGSCPCQPYSVAGGRLGDQDERNLWPEMRRLISYYRPPTIFGEQVASKDGREWFAGVRADLEALGYAVGAANLCAAGEGAPHIRQRLYWVANSATQRRESRNGSFSYPTTEDEPQLSKWKNRRSCDLRVWDSFSSVSGDSRKRFRISVEPGTFPLADGVPARVGRLRGYGNAIVPQVAAKFIKAFLEAESYCKSRYVKTWNGDQP